MPPKYENTLASKRCGWGLGDKRYHRQPGHPYLQSAVLEYPASANSVMRAFPRARGHIYVRLPSSYFAWVARVVERKPESRLKASRGKHRPGPPKLTVRVAGSSSMCRRYGLQRSVRERCRCFYGAYSSASCLQGSRMRRCNAKCYNARGQECSCLCGGVNHGVGEHQAFENCRATGFAWAKRKQLRYSKRRKLATQRDQGELFPVPRENG